MEADYDPVRFGKRVKEECDKKGLDPRALSSKLQELTDARGTSYGSVYSYMKGQGPASPPRRQVVEAMAQVFDCLPSYLLYGGPRTAAAQVAEETAAKETTPPLLRGVFQARFEGPSAAAIAALTMAWGAWADGYSAEELAEEVEMADTSGRVERVPRSLRIAVAVTNAVYAPLTQLGISPPPGEARDDFVVSVATALRQYIRREQPRNEEEDDG